MLVTILLVDAWILSLFRHADIGFTNSTKKSVQIWLYPGSISLFLNLGPKGYEDPGFDASFVPYMWDASKGLGPLPARDPFGRFDHYYSKEDGFHIIRLEAPLWAFLVLSLLIFFPLFLRAHRRQLGSKRPKRGKRPA